MMGWKGAGTSCEVGSGWQPWRDDVSRGAPFGWFGGLNCGFGLCDGFVRHLRLLRWGAMFPCWR
ncbi:MAG: hypothetical protein DVB22_000758 [Verrucomicrobia bacterium]|jgi:hypothetical protein|nr:MAG: hypothetical protein DVB22_000758 [Verrucomicrobiota bacterium]